MQGPGLARPVRPLALQPKTQCGGNSPSVSPLLLLSPIPLAVGPLPLYPSRLPTFLPLPLTPNPPGPAPTPAHSPPLSSSPAVPFPSPHDLGPPLCLPTSPSPSSWSWQFLPPSQTYLFCFVFCRTSFLTPLRSSRALSSSISTLPRCQQTTGVESTEAMCNDLDASRRSGCKESPAQPGQKKEQSLSKASAGHRKEIAGKQGTSQGVRRSQDPADTNPPH